MAAPQAPPSLGFSGQEHWSGLPFPSPMHESEKWKWSHSVVSDSQRPHRLRPTRLLRPWDFPGKSTGVGCHCLLCHKRYAYHFILHLLGHNLVTQLKFKGALINMCMYTLSHVGLFVTPCTIALQAPLHGIFQARILAWVAISYPGIEPASLESPAFAGRFFTTSATWEDFTFCPINHEKGEKWMLCSTTCFDLGYEIDISLIYSPEIHGLWENKQS